MTENIKDALKYAVELSEQEEKIIVDDVGIEWYDANKYDLRELTPKFYPKTLYLNTLDSLINYYKNDINEISQNRTIVVVDNPREIYVYTEDDEQEERTTLIRVEASLPGISFGSFMPADLFNIELQSKYENKYDRQNVLDFASSIVIDNGADVEDDGVAQITTIKQGVASRAKAKAPNPVTLAPYRTFLEVEQPASDFVLRLNKEAELALFEADGGAWKLNAVNNIKEYLQKELKEIKNVFVLA